MTSGIGQHSHIHAGACCPLHMIAGGFAMSGQFPVSDSSEALISFGDATPKAPSHHCDDDRSATDRLYEQLVPRQLLVFRSARVVTMRDDEVLDKYDVFVRDGIIEELSPAGRALPEGAVIIDASGKTLIPGLSEIHAHIFTDGWARGFGAMLKGKEDAGEYLLPYDLMMFVLLANGITRVEIMAGCPDALWMRDSIRSGSLIGPKMTVGSPIVDGPVPMHSPWMSYLVGDYEGGMKAADEIARLGFDFAKPYSLLPAEGYEGLMDGCEKHGIRVMGHVPKSVGIDAVIERGQQGVAHATEMFWWETEPERSNRARLERLARKLAAAGTWLQATVVVGGNAEAMIAGKKPRAPDRAWMNPLQVALFADDSPLPAMFRSMPDRVAMFENAGRLSCEATRAAREAGCRVLTGTDFTNPFLVEGFSLHEELEMLVAQCGFTPQDALFASTRLAAEYHEEGDLDGMITPGAVADLVLLEGDPLADISATRGVEVVLARTVLLRKSAREIGLRRVRAAYDAMPKPIIEVSPVPESGAAHEVAST